MIDDDKRIGYWTWALVALVLILIVAIIGNLADENNHEIDPINENLQEEQVVEVVEEEAIEENQLEDESTQEEFIGDEVEESEKELVFGEVIEFEDFNMMITNLMISVDIHGDPVLVYTYSWENTSETDLVPTDTFLLRAYQENGQTESTPVTMGLNLEGAQLAIPSEGMTEDLQGAVGIDDMNQAISLELSETSSANSEVYTTRIDNLRNLNNL